MAQINPVGSLITNLFLAQNGQNHSQQTQNANQMQNNTPSVILNINLGGQNVPVQAPATIKTLGALETLQAGTIKANPVGYALQKIQNTRNFLDLLIQRLGTNLEEIHLSESYNKAKKSYSYSLSVKGDKVQVSEYLRANNDNAYFNVRYKDQKYNFYQYINVTPSKQKVYYNTYFKTEGASFREYFNGTPTDYSYSADIQNPKALLSGLNLAELFRSGGTEQIENQNNNQTTQSGGSVTLGNAVQSSQNNNAAEQTQKTGKNSEQNSNGNSVILNVGNGTEQTQNSGSTENTQQTTQTNSPSVILGSSQNRAFEIVNNNTVVLKSTENMPTAQNPLIFKAKEGTVKVWFGKEGSGWVSVYWEGSFNKPTSLTVSITDAANNVGGITQAGGHISSGLGAYKLPVTVKLTGPSFIGVEFKK